MSQRVNWKSNIDWFKVKAALTCKTVGSKQFYLIIRIVPVTGDHCHPPLAQCSV